MARDTVNWSNIHLFFRVCCPHWLSNTSYTFVPHICQILQWLLIACSVCFWKNQFFSFFFFPQEDFTSHLLLNNFTLAQKPYPMIPCLNLVSISDSCLGCRGYSWPNVSCWYLYHSTGRAWTRWPVHDGRRPARTRLEGFHSSLCNWRLHVHKLRESYTDTNWIEPRWVWPSLRVVVWSAFLGRPSYRRDLFWPSFWIFARP